MDGRLVFVAIKNQAEGKHVVIAKAHAAYKAIADVKFTGKHKSTNFSTYSKIFHTFDHLQEVGQDMSKVQKIKVFCDGIDCRALDIAKGDITFHANLYPTYESAQEVLNTAWRAAKKSLATAPPDSRTVVAAGTSNFKNNNKNKNNNNNQKNNNKSTGNKKNTYQMPNGSA
jgi:hypothetical protein